MKRSEKLLADISSVKIQGARAVARAGINAYLLEPSEKNYNSLMNVRPTEPMLFNSLKILKNSKNKQQKEKQLLNFFEESQEKISNYGTKLIKTEMNIFTHCHSSTVISILIKAKKQGKKFTVFNTETRPLFQGRKTAKELAKAGIKVVHVSDSDTEFSLEKCDLFLFGADAYTGKGVINKIGTSQFCEIAKIKKIPCYSAGSLLKYQNKIALEFRKGKELWDEREKNIEVINPAFDLSEKNLIQGIICEKGILSYKQFLSEAKKFKL